MASEQINEMLDERKNRHRLPQNKNKWTIVLLYTTGESLVEGLGGARRRLGQHHLQTGFARFLVRVRLVDRSCKRITFKYTAVKKRCCPFWAGHWTYRDTYTHLMRGRWAAACRSRWTTTPPAARAATRAPSLQNAILFIKTRCEASRGHGCESCPRSTQFASQWRPRTVRGGRGFGCTHSTRGPRSDHYKPTRRRTKVRIASL